MSGFGILVVVAPQRGRDNYGSMGMEGGPGQRSGKHQNGLCAVEGKRQKGKGQRAESKGNGQKGLGVA